MKIIAGAYKGRKLRHPSLIQTRPTGQKLRESIFNILAVILARENLSLEQMAVLDVFAGSGALGFEALSHGAKFVTFIDKDRNACRVIHENAQHLSVVQKTLILQGDALYPQVSKKQYDLIFLDPPYNQGLIKPAFEALKTKKWVATGALIVMEFSSKEPNPHLEAVDILLEKLYGSTRLMIGRSTQNK